MDEYWIEGNNYLISEIQFLSATIIKQQGQIDTQCCRSFSSYSNFVAMKAKHLVPENLAWMEYNDMSQRITKQITNMFVMSNIFTCNLQLCGWAGEACKVVWFGFYA